MLRFSWETQGPTDLNPDTSNRYYSVFEPEKKKKEGASGTLLHIKYCNQKCNLHIFKFNPHRFSLQVNCALNADCGFNTLHARSL